MRNPPRKKGDYVLATKYGDGDPGDQWCVGFFDEMYRDRYMVIDSNGQQFRGNGFRRAEKITTECGHWIVKNIKLIEQCSITIWGVRGMWRKLSVSWSDLSGYVK